MQNIAINRVILSTIGLIAGFLLLSQLFQLDTLIYLLNSVFAGAMIAVLVSFGPLLKNAVLGVRPYDRVRQMTLGFFLCWLGYAISVYTSIYARSADFAVTSMLATAASRYIVISAAILQVTAPDFGLGIFHGRDRKTLWTGLTIGTVFAILVFVMQKDSILKPFVNALSDFNIAMANMAG